MKTTTMFVIIGLFIGAQFYEVPAQPQYQTIRQPDGTTFQAVERGEQFLQFLETPEGFIVRRGRDGYYQYFTINASGEFVATGLKVGIDLPANVPIRPYNQPAVQQALIRNIQAFNAAAEANRQRYLQRQRGGGSSGISSKSPSFTTQSLQQEVTLQVGVLLVEFNDVPHYIDTRPQPTRPNGYTIADFETMLFSDNQYISPAVFSPDDENVFGSLRDYFEFQSHGLLHVTGQVINPNTGGIPTWLNMGNSSNYNNDPSGPNSIRDLLRNAINAAIGQGWNVNYDIISMVIAQDQYAPNVGFWTGYAYFRNGFASSEFAAGFDYANWFGGYALKEREDMEWRDPDLVTFTHIGLHCHEMFHVIGWGMYNILNLGLGQITRDLDVGDWSTMAMGYRTGLLRKNESPGDLDPVARVVMEWASPTLVNAHLLNESVQYLEVDNNPIGNFDFYQFNDPTPGSTQQFFVENRQYSGFNSFLPEWWKTGTKGGLLVWLRNGENRQMRFGDNSLTVVLEGMPNVSHGNLGDPFPGSTNNQAITMSTTPDTRIGGNPTGFAVTNISSSSTNMTANFYHNYWSGSITSNTTWLGEIYVGGNITVNSGVTLTVSPGATIRFASGTSLTVNGTLAVNGTQTQPVTFDRSGISGTWGGIRFNTGSSGTITYGTIDHVTKGVYVFSTDNVTITNCTIQNFSEQGIYVISSSVTVQNSTIQNPAGGSHGMYLEGKYSSPIITGNTVMDAPIGIERFSGPGAATIAGNTFTNCRDGVKTIYSSPEIYNNYFDGISNADYGIRIGTASSPNIHDNDFFDYTVGVYLEQSQPSNLKWNNFGYTGGQIMANEDRGIVVNYLTSGNGFLNNKWNNFYDGSSAVDIFNYNSTTLNAQGNYWYSRQIEGNVDSSNPQTTHNNDAGPGGGLGKIAAAASNDATPTASTVPETFGLEQNFPNPFNPGTVIGFKLPQAAIVTLTIYDLLGRRVRTLLSGFSYEPGFHNLTWDGTDDSGQTLTSGIYIYRIEAKSDYLQKSYSESRKLLFTR